MPVTATASPPRGTTVTLTLSGLTAATAYVVTVKFPGNVAVAGGGALLGVSPGSNVYEAVVTTDGTGAGTLTLPTTAADILAVHTVEVRPLAERIGTTTAAASTTYTPVLAAG
jgi:hypothetical protein